MPDSARWSTSTTTASLIDDDGMRLGFAVVVAALLMFGAGVAAAQVNLEAEQAFRDGKRLMSDKRFAEACDAFATSQRLEQNIATLMSLADCREKNGQIATAWGLFLEAEQKTRSAADLQDLHQTADARSVALESRLSYITINVPDESRLKGLVVYRDDEPIDPGLWNRAVPVDGGQHRVEAKAPGHEPWLTLVQVAAEKDRQAVEVPRFKDLPALVKPVAKSPSTVEPEPLPLPPAPEGKKLTPKRKVAVGVGAAGVVALGVGVVFWNKADGLESDARELCPPTNCSITDADAANDINDDARGKAMIGNIAFGAGLAAVVAGGMLWYVGGPPTTSGVAIHPQVGGVTGLALTGAF
jgi:hypothetical protein